MLVFLNALILAMWTSKLCQDIMKTLHTARVRVPGQTSKRNVFLRRLSLSRFLEKALRVNKNCHEKFLKKSVVRGRL